jgi:predicted RNase H-like HicB family nuclease
MKNMMLEISENGYEPGHCSMYYDEGSRVLVELKPENKPYEMGDYMVEYTVNGDWRFTIKLVEELRDLRNNEEHIAGDYSRAEDITPLIEALITSVASSDGDEFEHLGNKYSIEWWNNNWFEVFIYIFDAKDGKWHGTNDGIMTEDQFGQTPDELVDSLQETLESFIKGDDDNDLTTFVFLNDADTFSGLEGAMYVTDDGGTITAYNIKRIVQSLSKKELSEFVMTCPASVGKSLGEEDDGGSTVESQALIDSYPMGSCPECDTKIPDDVEEGQQCANCGHTFVYPRGND